MGRWPMAHPPGSGMRASCSRASSVPKTSTEARILRTSSSSCGFLKSLAVRMSAPVSRRTRQPQASSSEERVVTSVRLGGFSMRTSSRVSSAPNMMGSTAFLDVLMGISPRRGGLSRTA